MAPRRSAERFLAAIGSAAGAGLVPALAAVAALALAGCGGGSSSTSSTSAATTGSTSARGAQTGEGSGAKEAQGNSKESGPAGSESHSGGASPGSHEGKHGPKVKVPKSEPEPPITKKQKAHATIANITMASPALRASGSIPPLPAAYTCDGADSWPELRWQGVPSTARELVLFMINVRPVGQSLFFDWALAGLDPASEGIEAGKLPKGAIVGRNGFGKLGYSVCPPKGEGETYVFALYALPRALSPKRGFDPMALRKAALAEHANAGLLATSYSRG